MKKIICALILCTVSSLGHSQTMDMTIYLTPDYGGCTGKLEFSMCGIVSTTTLLDGFPYPSVTMPAFSTLCAGTHSMSFTGSDAGGALYNFNATFDVSPSSASITVSG